MIKEIKDSIDKARITERILRSLPDWFGIESAIIEYIKESTELDMIGYVEDDEVIGFLTPKATSPYAMSIHLMGIHPNYHHQGIGTKLFKYALDKAKEQGYKYFTVKTLDEKHPDSYYQKTRLFYESLGFQKLETFDTLWGKENPCVLLILQIA